MEAFAAATDLATRLNRVFTAEEEAWIDELLADASAHLRSIIGQQVFPRQTVTYTAYPQAGREDLPQWPVVSVTSVTRESVPIDFEYRPGFILVSGDDPCEVTFTFGLTTAPDELKRLACVLVSSALLPLEQKLGLTAGGLSSVAIDDFKLAWADAGEQSGMALTKHAEASIRRQFGRGDVVMVETGR